MIEQSKTASQNREQQQALFLQNPLQLRLEKFQPWQLSAFSLMLCERFYPNYALFCQHYQYDSNRYHVILDLLWQALTVKNIKIDFELQLEKLEAEIPQLETHDLYLTTFAIDACQALAELLHSVLDKDELFNYTIKISQLSVQNVMQVYQDQHEGVEINNDNQKQFDVINDEWDAQWELYRLLKEQDERDVALLISLREELRSPWVSPIGIEL